MIELKARETSGVRGGRSARREIQTSNSHRLRARISYDFTEIVLINTRTADPRHPPSFHNVVVDQKGPTIFVPKIPRLIGLWQRPRR